MLQLATESCEDVVMILDEMGFHRSIEVSDELAGLPIDRRRREADERGVRAERRSTLKPGPQEKLELTEEEHRFLDALKQLRQITAMDIVLSQQLSVIYRCWQKLKYTSHFFL